MPFLMLALPWLRRFGPWIVLGLVAIGIYAAGGAIVHDWKKSIHDAAYQDGVANERTRQDQIAKKIEDVLTPRLDAIDAKTGRQLDDQTKKEVQYVDRIKTRIKTDTRYTTCTVDDGVLRDRNAIRSSLGTTIDPTSGAGAGDQTPAAPAHN